MQNGVRMDGSITGPSGGACLQLSEHTYRHQCTVVNRKSPEESAPRRDRNLVLLRCRIAMMREGAFLINVSRGGLLDTEAAIDALERGQIGCLCVPPCIVVACARGYSSIQWLAHTDTATGLLRQSTRK